MLIGGVAPSQMSGMQGEEELPAIKTAATAERQQSAPAIAVTAPDEHRESSVPNPTARLSTLGLVEEWRLTALIHGLDDGEPQSVGQGNAKAEETKVA